MMKLTIRPMVEIDVDDINHSECGDCTFMQRPPTCELFCINIAKSRKFGAPKWNDYRCQECLDAEKEK